MLFFVYVILCIRYSLYMLFFVYVILCIRYYLYSLFFVFFVKQEKFVYFGKQKKFVYVILCILWKAKQHNLKAILMLFFGQ